MAGLGFEGLPTPRTGAGRDGLARLVAQPATVLVALDYDGTLAPIVPDPEAAVPVAGAVEALHRAAGVFGTVAVITGRTLASLQRLAPLPADVVVLAAHGHERWPPVPGHPQTPARDVMAQVRPELAGLLADLGLPAWTLEDKGTSLAVHTRRLAHPEQVWAAVRAPLAELAARHGLGPLEGRLVWELRLPGTDKGTALSALVAELRPGVVVMAGDDVVDLEAFDVVDHLRSSGEAAGLTVASAAEGRESGRPGRRSDVAERADLVVPGPSGVVALIERLVAAADAARPRPAADADADADAETGHAR